MSAGDRRGLALLRLPCPCLHGPVRRVIQCVGVVDCQLQTVGGLVQKPARVAGSDRHAVIGPKRRAAIDQIVSPQIAARIGHRAVVVIVNGLIHMDPPCVSALDAADVRPAEQLLLPDEKQQNRRDQRQDQRREQRAPVGRVALLLIERCEADRHGLLRLIRQHDERNREFVPRAHCRDHADRHNAGLCHRNDHIAQNAEIPAAVDHGGLLIILWNGAHKAGKEKKLQTGTASSRTKRQEPAGC